MHYRQVSVDAHEGDEKDARVITDMVGSQHHLAHGVPKAPVVSGLVGQEGKGTEEQEVGDGQVEKADVGHAA